MTHARETPRREPLDGSRLLEARLDMAVSNVSSFSIAVAGCVEAKDWSGTVQTARGLLDAARNLLETAVAREVFAHIAAGAYTPVKKGDARDKA